MTLEAGTRLGSYEIVAPIGAGAMGEVYRAKDLKLGRDVAVKVLPESLAVDGERLRRFEQEAQAASALNHPNIVHIYDVGREHDLRYLVMELVDGETLRSRLAGAPLDPERLLDLGRQLAAGLAKAHGAGIVHRDLKPENLMITRDGFVKILDFGLAKLTQAPFEAHSELATIARQGTRHGMLIGTVEYMSPEQAAGKPVDHRSDQFSLGLILYEMATGKIAFRRETAAQTLASIIESDPQPLAELRPGCPPSLSRIVARLLEKRPEGRYADTAELLRELRAVSLAEPPEEVPIPPVPQSLEPDVPPLSIAFRVDDRHADKVQRAAKALGVGLEEGIHLRTSDGQVRVLSEARLRKRLRKHHYSEDDRVRVGERGEWVPLVDSEIFREEVYFEGDPRDVVRRRKLAELGQHAGTFVLFGIAWYVFRGEVPFWMGFWGIGRGVHAVNTLPAALPLLRRRKLAAHRAPGEAVIDNEPALAEAAAVEPVPALVDDSLPASFRAEIERVKVLLSARGGDDAPALVAEVDAIAGRVRDLAAKDRDLAEQTSSEERASLSESLAEAERKLIAADNANDRRLYQRQYDVLSQRERTIEKALVVRDRLRARQDVAENQVKQLRLDLSRAAASSSSVPELTSRLQDIRHEVDATQQVDQAIAQELSS